MGSVVGDLESGPVGVTGIVGDVAVAWGPGEASGILVVERVAWVKGGQGASWGP